MGRGALAATSVALLILLAAGCNERSAPSTTQRDRKPWPNDIVELTVGERVLKTEVVFDPPSRQRGLMYREMLPDDRGMLFIFPFRERQSFWMRNTLIPLSIAFISDDGRILEIRSMRPKDESSTRSRYEVRYALEVADGWFERAGVGVGYKLPSFEERVEAFLGSVR